MRISTPTRGSFPARMRRPFDTVPEWAREFAGQSAIVICQKGLKLSQGVAAWLRHAGMPADSLEGGALGLGASRSAHGARGQAPTP